MNISRGLALLNVQRGDRVAVLMLNCHRYLELYYACARMGAIIVPLNIRLARPEIVFILNDSETKVLIVDKTFASYVTGRDTYPSVENILYNGDETPEGMLHFEELVSKGAQIQQSADQEMEDNDISGLYYTGGTTGRAKGVMLSHQNVVSNAFHMIMATSYTGQDTYLHAGPMFHLADIASTFAVTMVGGCHVFIPLFNPVHMLEAVQREKVTTTLIVPTMINALLNYPDADHYDISSLRRITYGGSPMPLELLKKGLQKWGPIFVQAYGMTEAAPLLTMLDPQDCSIEGTPEQLRRLASCGKESLGVEVRIVNSGGENIYCVEVENALYTHPAVLEAAVVGIPDETWGEAVHAVIVCKPGTNVSSVELISHVRTQIASYKTPRSIEFRTEALPKSGAGKILKRDLREKYWEGKSRRVN